MGCDKVSMHVINLCEIIKIVIQRRQLIVERKKKANSREKNGNLKITQLSPKEVRKKNRRVK